MFLRLQCGTLRRWFKDYVVNCIKACICNSFLEVPTFPSPSILKGDANGQDHTVDCRPSDAVALALNRKIPILVNKKLFRRELTREEIKEYEEICKTVKF